MILDIVKVDAYYYHLLFKAPYFSFEICHIENLMYVLPPERKKSKVIVLAKCEPEHMHLSSFWIFGI